MKKLFFLVIMSITAIIQSCPSCIGWDHQRKLRRQAAEIQSCPCDCPRQYHTTPANDDKKGGYWCRVCNHRFIPRDPLEKSKIPDFLNPKTSDLARNTAG